jgi:transposase
MKAIHGGKAKNDKIDAHKIAVRLRGGMMPQAYVYPAEMSSTRDLLRRRMLRMRRRAELLAHIQRTNHQYNLADIGKKIAYRSNRDGVAERFVDPSMRSNVTLDLKRIGFYDNLLNEVELEILRHARQHDANSLHLLDTVPGIGKILGLVILYEVHDIHRFPSVQDFASYCRLVKPQRESAGKISGWSGQQHRKREPEVGLHGSGCRLAAPQSCRQAYLAREEKKHGKAKALTALAHELARAVYHMLLRQEAFDMKRFFNR